MASWYIPWPFNYLVAVWYIFPRFGILYQEKSGKPWLASLNQSIKNLLKNERANFRKVILEKNSGLSQNGINNPK
jgi:hypothetical protein